MCSIKRFLRYLKIDRVNEKLQLPGIPLNIALIIKDKQETTYFLNMECMKNMKFEN